MFIGRQEELQELCNLYAEERFQLFVLYGRRRVGKTTLLNEFCKGKPTIFYSAELSNTRLNLEKFSQEIFRFYGETNLEPFSSWEKALTYIDSRQAGKRLILILDEFPYLVRKNKALLSELQHLIDHKLSKGRLFLVLCGSYMGFMEKEVLGSKSPLFGRRTAQLCMKPLDYRAAIPFMRGFSDEDAFKFYGAFGGTPLYLSQIRGNESFANNIKNAFLRVTAYLYEEPLLLLRQEVQEPGVYSAIIEAIAGGYSKSNEIATKIGEDNAKCIKYINTLCELGLVYKETPFAEKESSRKTIYGISDLMFRFWYRYVFTNRTLIETGAVRAVWDKKIEPDYSHYMGVVFERAAREYLLRCNKEMSLPFLFTSIGRWWGTDKRTHGQAEIDLVASDGRAYLFGECKWKKEAADLPMLQQLQDKAEVFMKNREASYYILFSKSGFSKALLQEQKKRKDVMLVDLKMMLGKK